jgi:hypothetical protein
MVVIDLDVPKPGDDPRPPEWDRPDIASGEDVFLSQCLDAGQTPPVDTFTVATASGGTHLYYTAPAGIQLRNTGGDRGNGLGWKIDTRSWGGQVVAPGSVVHGRAYRVVLDIDPMPLPGWLCDRLRAPAPAPLTMPRPAVGIRHRDRYADAAVKATQAKVRAARTNRNAALWGAAVSLGQLVEGGQLSERDHAEALMDAASGHIAVGAYSARQAAATITSGLRKGRENGRQVSA